jgi:hypothetical protein
VKWFFAILLALLLGFCFFPEPELTPEQAVIASIEDAAEAARRARPGDFMDHIAPEYQDQHMSRKTLKAFITRRLLAQGGLAVHLSSITVEIAQDGEHAVAEFEARFPDSLERVRPGAEDIRFFSLDMVQLDGDWQIEGQTHQNR